MKSTAQGLFSHHIFADIYLCFPFLLFAYFIFQIYIIKNPKIHRLILFAFILFASTNLSLYQSFTREGLTTPLRRRVVSICSLCAGTIYIVLLGSPTGSITLVS